MWSLPFLPVLIRRVTSTTLRSATNQPLPREAFVDGVDDGAVEFLADAEAALERVAERTPVGLLTNGPSGRRAATVATLGLDRLGAVVYAGDERRGPGVGAAFDDRRRVTVGVRTSTRRPASGSLRRAPPAAGRIARVGVDDRRPPTVPVGPTHRVAAVASSAVDSAGAVTTPGHPPVDRDAAVAFHRRALERALDGDD